MKLYVYLVPSAVDEGARTDRVVVIDVLRSCTSLAYAVENGAEKIIPAESVEVATKLLSTLPRDMTLLCGERDGKKIPGFDLGNSPLEYTSETISGKTLIFSSTNGTRAIAKGSFAREVVLCSFVNLGAVVEYLKESQTDISVICSGKLGQTSLEDTVCAGMLVERMTSEDRSGFELNDGSQIALLTAKAHAKNIRKMILEASHGVYLSSLGFTEDLEIASALDSVPVVPVVRDGRITRDKAK
ncbi:MAG: 2-phosphosulfolactate phosphatase [Candidatus Eisenbacteria bacterium]|nr:2-phosphosulfolactate phosphatase [Candidatus Eisenbacteria bacterium]